MVTLVWYIGESVGVHFIEHDQFRILCYQELFWKDIGISILQTWDYKMWLTSNSLYFDTRPSRFLIQPRKAIGYSQVLVVVSCGSRWDWPFLKTEEDADVLI